MHLLPRGCVSSTKSIRTTSTNVLPYTILLSTVLTPSNYPTSLSSMHIWLPPMPCPGMFWPSYPSPNKTPPLLLVYSSKFSSLNCANNSVFHCLINVSCNTPFSPRTAIPKTQGLLLTSSLPLALVASHNTCGTISISPTSPSPYPVFLEPNPAIPTRGSEATSVVFIWLTIINTVCFFLITFAIKVIFNAESVAFQQLMDKIIQCRHAPLYMNQWLPQFHTSKSETSPITSIWWYIWRNLTIKLLLSDSEISNSLAFQICKKISLKSNFNVINSKIRSNYIHKHKYFTKFSALYLYY